MPPPHVALTLLAPLLLAGCLSPDARCFAEATQDYRAAWREARILQGDLARGHALVAVETRGLVPSTCRAGAVPTTCLVERRRAVLLPVTIDPQDHRARLFVVEKEMDTLRPAAMAAAAPCGYRPHGSR